MRELRVYVDTSVFGGTQDEEFAEPSLRFFDRVRKGEFTVVVSQVSLDELHLAPPAVRGVLDGLADEAVETAAIADDVRTLAAAYVAAGALGEASEEDALHVAAATIARVDLLVSWNFRHIVNLQRIRMFNSVNLAAGYGLIDVRSPLEVVYGREDEDV